MAALEEHENFIEELLSRKENTIDNLADVFKAWSLLV